MGGGAVTLLFFGYFTHKFQSLMDLTLLKYSLRINIICLLNMLKTPFSAREEARGVRRCLRKMRRGGKLARMLTEEGRSSKIAPKLFT